MPPRGCGSGGLAMSVRTMTKVWESSQHRGSDLLMLLAIADFADDDGNAYPSVQTLAKKCRMKPRNTTAILTAIRKSGELEVRQNAGPHGTNRYRIVLPLQSPQERAGVQKRAGAQIHAAPPAETCRFPLQDSADEPSVNHQEPSTALDARKRSNAALEFSQFWDAYPKKVAKANAQKAWERQKPDLAEVLKAVECCKASDQWRQEQYIPHPATWINGRRWEDELQFTRGTVVANQPKPGDRRTRYRMGEVFDATLGWMPE